MLIVSPRSREIAEGLRRLIVAGELRPGDRLPAIKVLCRQNQAGQRTIEGAVALLQTEGLVQTRRRSGTFVTAPPQPPPPDPQPQPIPRPPDNYSALRGLRGFLEPRLTSRRTLRMYVSSLDATAVAEWREVLRVFPAADVELVSCQSGHLEELWDRHHFDLVQTTAGILRSLGPERFLPYEVLREQLPPGREERLLPVVRERLEQGPDPLGVPFCVTVCYLFANLRLEAAAGIDARAYPDAFTWLEEVLPLTNRLRRRQSAPLVLTSLFDLLLLTGAVSWRRETGVRIDEAAAARLFELLAGSDLPLVNDVLPPLYAGTVMHAQHCSFEVPALGEHVTYPWEARPLPMAPHLRRPAWLTVFAVPRAARDPGLCRELLRFLATPEVQMRFGRRHDNLPVDAEVLAQVVAPDGGQVTRATVDAALDQSTLLWPEEHWHGHAALPGLESLRFGLPDGRLSVAEALRRFRYLSAFRGAESPG